MNHELLPVLLRTVIIYSAGLLVLRLAGSRFLARESPFDVIIAFTLGSTLSRAINGSATPGPTIAAVALLLLLHALVALLSFHYPRLNRLFRGTPTTLIQDGKINEAGVKKYYLTEGDLLESLRIKGKVTEIEKVDLGVFECNGTISVIPKKKRKSPPKVVEIGVEAGVKTVRIELSQG